MHAFAVATLLAAHGLAPGGIDALVDSSGALRGVILTYGIVVYTDDDVPLWVCEEATGEDGIPRGGVALDDGTLIVVGPRKGLFVSDDLGCSWRSVPALAELIVTGVRRDAEGRVVFSTRDPRAAAIVGLLDAETLEVEVLASFDAAIVESFVSDGARVAAALTGVGDGGARFVIVDDGGTREIATNDASVTALSVDESGVILAAVEEGGEFVVREISAGDTLSPLALARFPARPRAILRFDGEVFASTSEGVLRGESEGSLSVVLDEFASCLVGSVAGVLTCASGRDREVLVVRDALASGFTTATVRPRACAEGTRAHDVCPAIWDLIHSSQAIGRELPALDDDDEVPTCAHTDSGRAVPRASLVLAILVATRSRRRR